MGLLEGKSIFVTGGSSGIGRAIALAAGREGARYVWVATRNPEPHEGGETTVDLLHAAGTASEFVTLDVADTAAVFAAIEATKTQGGVDVMVCSAGINAKEDFLAITPEQFDRMKAVNLDGTLFAAQAAAKQMVAMEKRGAIVVIGSIGGLRGMRFSTMYSGLKAALINMTSSMADALGPLGIRINTVNPGITETSLVTGQGPEFQAMIGKVVQKIPLRRQGQPNEIAEAVVFLASDRASFITGASLTVDGGLSALM